jgi:O-acetyl-ADP-ribose deacetylase (regulator of RNase III)
MNMQHDISIVLADITTLEVDAIVNAANSTLLGGGGVDGAIHRKAGPELLAECRMLGGCPTGEARITSGYGLPTRYVIHTVGPIWRGGNNREASLLANCYQSCLHLAQEKSIASIAFPAISTGVYGYPLEAATTIAIDETRRFLAIHPGLRIIFACFDQTAEQIYYQGLNRNPNGGK